METVRANLTRAIRAALKDAPGSTRALSRAAGVSHTVLVRIRRGTLAGTPTVALKIAVALEVWATRCGHAAKDLRQAARKDRNPRTGRQR